MVTYRIKRISGNDHDGYGVVVEVVGTSWIMGMGPTNEFLIQPVKRKILENSEALHKLADKYYEKQLSIAASMARAKQFEEHFTGMNIDGKR